MVSKYDPAATARAIAEEGITILNGVPATYQRLLEYKTVTGLAQLARGSLRLIAVAGAPLDLELKSRVEREFGLPLSMATASPNARPAYPAYASMRRAPTRRSARCCRASRGGSGRLDGMPTVEEERSASCTCAGAT